MAWEACKYLSKEYFIELFYQPETKIMMQVIKPTLHSASAGVSGKGDYCLVIGLYVTIYITIYMCIFFLSNWLILISSIM